MATLPSPVRILEDSRAKSEKRPGDISEALLLFLVAVAVVVGSCSMGASDDALRSAGETPDGEIGFYVSGGSTFSPKIFLADGGTAVWRFTAYDGGTVSGLSSSTSTSPSVVYSGTMLVTLEVSPWSALEALDLGYDGGDGGSLDLSTYACDPQNLFEVRNLDLARDSLKIWCSSHNMNLTSLDFSGFSRLTTVECYYESAAVGLVDIDLAGTPNLTRLCLENNSLASLDLSDCPNLEDLRGALNAYTSIVFPTGGLTKLWHLCVRDNPQLEQELPIGDMPVLMDCIIANSNQSGIFVPVSSVLRYVWIYNNDYESLDFRGAGFSEEASLQAQNCASCGSVLFGDTVPQTIDLSNCALSAQAIADILTALDDSGLEEGSLDVSGNTGDLDTASDAHASLVGKGWALIDD